MAIESPWAELGGLMLAAQREMLGHGAGRHASVLRGHGLEFYDYHPYAAGDDPADVDWKLFGRSDRLYLRRRQQPSNLHVLILLDVSRSMDYPTGSQVTSKWHHAALLAASIATLAIRGRDRPALGLCSDRLDAFVPPGSSVSHLRRLCATLESAEPGGNATDWAATMKHATDAMHRARSGFRGMLVVIGDLLDEPDGLFDGLARFGHRGFDTTVLQVLTPDELNPAHLPAGPIRLLEPESAAMLRSDGRSVARMYEAAITAHRHGIERGCRARGARYALVSTQEPVYAVLRRTVAGRSA